jgi:hypothetical protein
MGKSTIWVQKWTKSARVALMGAIFELILIVGLIRDFLGFRVVDFSA